MKNSISNLAISIVLMLGGISATAQVVTPANYTPTKENLEARAQFENGRLGIFLHWGIYSMFAQGEWYLNNGKLLDSEYVNAASGFYPSKFDASEWAKAFKEAGASYVTLTSRHHDGFSLFKTSTSDYNIVDGTPFKRDVVGELANACVDEGLRFHLYYSILDWHRPDYPLGRTGLNTGRPKDRQDYDSYFNFMKVQVKELLTNYPVGALWFDGYWDQNVNPTFNWRMPEFYEYIHSIKPDCLIGNNHHISPLPGEDFQMFEQDLPGENTAGLSGQAIGRLPLEACITMNRAWGYNISDKNYKSLDEIIRLLVRSASKSSNLLLNIGPRPDGKLPVEALERLKGLGAWMKTYAPTINGTTSTSIPVQPWGVTTRTAGKIFLHILNPDALPSNGNGRRLMLPFSEKLASVTEFKSGKALTYKASKDGFVTIDVPATGLDTPDYVVTLELK